MHFESAYFLTLVWMPPADEASRTEGWLLENGPERGASPQDPIAGFVGLADRLVDLFDGFMPDIVWLSDVQAPTYLHSTVSTRRQRVRVRKRTVTAAQCIARGMWAIAQKGLLRLQCRRPLGAGLPARRVEKAPPRFRE